MALCYEFKVNNTLVLKKVMSIVFICDFDIRAWCKCFEIITGGS